MVWTWTGYFSCLDELADCLHANTWMDCFKDWSVLAWWAICAVFLDNLRICPHFLFNISTHKNKTSLSCDKDFKTSTAEALFCPNFKPTPHSVVWFPIPAVISFLKPACLKYRATFRWWNTIIKSFASGRKWYHTS